VCLAEDASSKIQSLEQTRQLACFHWHVYASRGGITFEPENWGTSFRTLPGLPYAYTSFHLPVT